MPCAGVFQSLVLPGAMAEHDSPPAPTEGCTGAQVEMLALYLKCTTECVEGVQKLHSPKFYNRQCEYLIEKLQKFVPLAGVVLHRLGSSVDAERHIEVLKLALVLAKRIESFVKSCSNDLFIQAAMGLTNTSKYVASLGFDLELCRIALCKEDGCSGRLTLNQVEAKYEDEVKEVEKKVSDDVKTLVTTVLHQLSEESLKDENRLMAIYLLLRLNKIDPTTPSIPSGSPLYSVIDDQGILGAMCKLVRPGRVIGRGGSATVYEATWLGTQVAKKTFVGRENSDFMMEAEILARFNHPNITSMFCCEKDRWSSSIIMEIMDGDLHTLMLERCRRAGCDNPPFTIFESVDIMLQIGEGVSYLHEKGICHRDLKSLNILVKSMSTSQSEVEVGYVHPKVADFGLSKTKNSTTFREQTLNTGSYRWMAPEIIALSGRSQGNTSSEPRHPLKIDVHGFAMLCYEILTGYFPFHDEANPRTIKENIKRGIRPELPNNCPPELKALIQECWDKIPRKRPSFPVICSKLKYVKYLLMTGFCSSEDIGASTSVKSEIAKPKIFVSYDVSDAAFVEQLSTDLRSALNHFVMFDQEVTKGENFGTIIRDATKECKVALFVLSEEFFNSKWQMVELVEFVRAAKDLHGSLRLIPLYYRISRQNSFKSWRPLWHEFARYYSQLVPEEYVVSFVRSLAAYNGLELVSFGGSEMKYRHAIVEGIASYDRECEELAWRMAPSCELYSEETSCSEQEHGYQIFLSHVYGRHLNFVEQLHKDLAVRNLSAFAGLQSVPLGEMMPHRVLDAVDRCQVAVMILSDEYLCHKSSMIELQRVVGRCQINNSIKMIPLFYKLPVDHVSEEFIQEWYWPVWKDISNADDRVEPNRWADAVRVLRTMKGLRLEDFMNSEVKYRHAIVEEIVQFLATQASEKKVPALI